MVVRRKKAVVLGTKEPYPGFIEPALATPVEKAPSGSVELQAAPPKRCGNLRSHGPHDLVGSLFPHVLLADVF
jgi:hypothetical protein